MFRSICNALFLAPLVLSSGASAGNILPNVTPDIILNCMEDGKVEPICSFHCSNRIRYYGQGEFSGVPMEKVSRVEILTTRKNSPGDQRIWVGFRSKATGDPETDSYIFAGPEFLCEWQQKRPGQGRWVIEKFDQ